MMSPPDQVASLGTRLASLELQFLQFRGEVKDEFLATRGEISKVRGEVDDLRGEIGVIATGLREAIRSGDTETRRYMRVLYEDLKADIRTIREG